jgi:ribulose-phosphate 3-epimerase
MIISPSLLASDFSNLESEIKKVYDAGCEYLHLDVMDGIFVKNITFGIPVISAIRKVCNIIFDTHLMIVKPERYIEDFARAGSDIITFHYESCSDEAEIYGTIEKIKSLDMKCSMSVRPDTDIEKLRPFLHLLDMALVMSVEPGFGGQKFIMNSLKKIERLRDIKNRDNLPFDIQVDGGVTLQNIAAIKKAGANVIVAGTAIFNAGNADDVKRAAEQLRSN